MKDWNTHGRRGGLGTLLSMLILIVLVLAGLVGIALYYSTIASGAASHSGVVFNGSMIKVNVATGAGYVFLKLYNQGPSAIMINEIDVKGTVNWFVSFDRTWINPRTSDNAAVCTYNGNADTGYAGADGSASMVLPGGAAISINCAFDGTSGHDITSYFEAPTGYSALLVLKDAAEQPFSINTLATP